MKSIPTLFLSCLTIALLLSSATCKTEQTPTSATPDPLLLKCWTNDFESEGTDNIRIFRSCMNHTFPAARYRNTFTLKENGEVEYSVLAANDAHTTENGKWTYDPTTKKLRISSNEDVLVEEYEVVELTEDLLRLKE